MATEYKTAVINIITTRTVKTESVERPLLWYDYETHQMKHMSGGQLKFNYDTENKKLTVSSAPLKVQKVTRGTNYQRIVDWIDDNSENLQLEPILIDGNSVTVRYPSNFENEVKESLESEGLDTQ